MIVKYLWSTSRKRKEVAHEAPEAEEGNIIVINTCGFIDNAKAESVNMILEYADKKERGLVDKVFVASCQNDTNLIKKEIPMNVFGTNELPALLKALELITK
jgi:ribosomal protein S12 methylthiotransferase